MKKYIDTGLWKRSMMIESRGAGNQQIERLAVSYANFWENACILAREIQRDVSNLTLHDESHFEALWRMADQIAGPQFLLSPLEAYVFGGAILLHDNANSVAAFSGGMTEIENSEEWKDYASELLNGRGGDVTSITPEDRTSILFNVLRNLHAERAKTLASMKVSTANGEFHLVSDDQLRYHLGDLMGLIAASHHWELSALAAKLPIIRGPLSDMPPTWSVRPILLACLLRCADAAQLDQSRTPDFLYGLLALRGISEKHWRGQNKISIPIVTQSDPESLIFSSTQSFSPSDAGAWWIAHDAIQVVATELQGSNDLLRDSGLPSFAVKRVDGASSPEKLSNHLRVHGWRPVQAEIKISQTNRIVEMFGGEQIYGRDFSAPVRELIQNAADAIRMRRALENDEYQGRIVVRTEAIAGSSDKWLLIDDDGLGMSEAVMIGPLIDFGSSYLSSSLVKWERPGLISKASKKRIGRFGVGFFSTFMLSEEILVSSRPFDQGKEALRTLHFTSGLKDRPLLLQGAPDKLSVLTSTLVKIRITEPRFSELLQLRSNAESRPLTLSALVGTLCPMLDVDVYVGDGFSPIKVHSRNWHEEDRVTWLKRIVAFEEVDGEPDDEIVEASKRLSFVNPFEPADGLACITPNAGLGVATIGSLKAGARFGGFRDEFAGAIDYEPAGPDRALLHIKDGKLLAAWASDQAIKYAQTQSLHQQRVVVSDRVAKFKGNASPTLVVKLNKSWVGIEEVFNSLKDRGAIFVPVKFVHQKKIVMTAVRERHWGFLDNYSPEELCYLMDIVEASGGEDLFSISLEGERLPYRFVDLLSAYSLENGFVLQADTMPSLELAKYVGVSSPRQKLEYGHMIVSNAIKFYLTPA